MRAVQKSTAARLSAVITRLGACACGILLLCAVTGCSSPPARLPAEAGSLSGAAGGGGAAGSQGVGGVGTTLGAGTGGVSGAAGAGLSGMAAAPGTGGGAGLAAAGTAAWAGTFGGAGGAAAAGSGFAGSAGSSGMPGVGGAVGAGGVGGSAGLGMGGLDAVGGMGGAAGLIGSRHKVVGYLTTRAGFANYATRIDFTRLTHINLSFANPGDGKLLTFGATADAEVAALVAAARPHGVKVLVSISSPSHVELVPGRVDPFVDAIDAFIDRYQLDGLDVDIEGDAVNQNYDPFIEKVDMRLRPRGKLLTAALGPWHARNVLDRTFARFDFINVMAYDGCGTWTPACPHSTLALAMGHLEHFVGRGVSADRLVLGVPFYGYCWGTGCPAGRTHSFKYREILPLYPETRTQDWITRPNMELSHNGEPTIREKAKLAKQYAGVMIWELFYDAEGADSLLTVLTDALWMP